MKLRNYYISSTITSSNGFKTEQKLDVLLVSKYIKMLHYFKSKDQINNYMVSNSSFTLPYLLNERIKKRKELDGTVPSFNKYNVGT